jgi:hypothetical protein
MKWLRHTSSNNTTKRNLDPIISHNPSPWTPFAIPDGSFLFHLFDIPRLCGNHIMFL